jgi:ubiquitin C-terminal hydrolase
MFGLNNYRGSCWINACLQGIFRFPEIQKRYNDNIFDKDNIIDQCLCKIWRSKGETGLKDLFEAVRTETMPAGHGIGDSHELFVYICDKVPFIDNLCRFKTADVIHCEKCGKKDIREDSVVEFTISSSSKFKPISECIAEAVSPTKIDGWVCEGCKSVGCTKQQLIGTFPQIMVFHTVSTSGSINYSSILVLNGKKYALMSVVCFTGGHWLTHGRNMPPGSSWYTFNDNTISDHGPKQFPVTNTMRILIYYRLED